MTKLAKFTVESVLQKIQFKHQIEALNYQPKPLAKEIVDRINYLLWVHGTPSEYQTIEAYLDDVSKSRRLCWEAAEPQAKEGNKTECDALKLTSMLLQNLYGEIDTARVHGLK